MYPFPFWDLSIAINSFIWIFIWEFIYRVVIEAYSSQDACLIQTPGEVIESSLLNFFIFVATSDDKVET
jgi:hypothetical protein